MWIVLGGFAALFVAGLVAYNLRVFDARSRGLALRERGVEVQATVTDAFESAGRYSRGVVEYRYEALGPDGQWTVFQGKGERVPGSVRHLGAGDTVPIRYLPEDPSVSQLVGNPLPGIEYVITLVVDVVSVVGVAVLAGMLLRERARRRRGGVRPSAKEKA